MGSTHDGPEDPHQGYAPYDYDSIMHYPAGNRMQTVPAGQEAKLGQRTHLSAGDVAQLFDMCGSSHLATPDKLSKLTLRITCAVLTARGAVTGINARSKMA